jgi:pimeloyl-ACP methyl ester carboxylesterase
MSLCHTTRKQRVIYAAFALLLAFGAFEKTHAAAASADAPADASAAAPNRFAATLVPAERFEVGGVLVERHGAAAGRPLILIPGLASGSWVWQDTIRAFAASHPIYVLTLPGFDGRPAAPATSASPFSAARAAVEQLIAERSLPKPVIVGHSLGGTLGYAVAEDRPAAVGGVVSIDGLPVMPGTETMAPAQRSQMAAGMRGRVATAPAAFARQQQGYMRTIGVLDMGKADALAQLSARSDPASTGQYAADVLNLDLRPGLKDIGAPLLVISPYHELDASQQGISESAKVDYYKSLLEGAPRVQVVSVAPARHFAMIDQPEKVIDAIRSFLASL